ncbi:MAG: protein translocase subunit SecD [Actinomycetota bacterium]|nr:protein translocase subunit SecD [Actinomycetota bacterium]
MVNRPIRLGLDLRGGTQIVLEAQATATQQVDADTVTRTLEVLRGRVDQLGVAEPSLQRSGQDRIIVELPGVTDPEQALTVIGRTAQLTFHQVLGIGGPRGQGTGPGGERERVFIDEEGDRLRLAPPALRGDGVGDAEAVVDPQLAAAWQVSISFRNDGGDKWADITGKAACEAVGSPQRRVAIVLDKDIISSPEVSPEVKCDVGITGGDTVITGDFTAEEAKNLALLIRAGALPVPVEVVEQRTIGPTLGDAAIRASLQAAIIGSAFMILYVIAYYRVLGMLAAVALLAYGVVSYAVLLALGATLTLPGIAGFVLAIGMAVDANVLVFERSKEEFAAGKRLRAAAHEGFKKAWSAIADSNATTLLAAIILFYFAAGAVRGFGITLTIGVLVSMFTALVVTRLLVEFTMRSPFFRSRPGALGMNVGGRLRKRLGERPIDVMSRSKWWFALSALMLAVALLGLVGRGLNFGLEFTGGRLIEYSTTRPADLDELRRELAGSGLPRAVVQESGDGNVSIRAGELSEQDETNIRAVVESLGGDADKVRDEFIGPTIGDELRRKALVALSLGLGVQLLYLAVRFRWTYGASAVVALFHDIMILLGIFAWLRKDIDGVFVAALLTVIGYSINDSVVVFDRIREQRRLRVKEPLSVVANDACLQTIPRTINTGLGALFILTALYFLGGETLTDFALALIVGILVGTYSSVFTAAPLAVAFDRLSPAPLPASTPRSTAREAALRQARQEPATIPAAADSGPAQTTSTAARPPRKRAGTSKRKRRRRR